MTTPPSMGVHELRGKSTVSDTWCGAAAKADSGSP
jgi:hypothetical protein